MPSDLARRNADWATPLTLIALSAIPLVAGALRLKGLAAHAPVSAENARFVAAPLPVVLHIVGASGFCVLGAFQFAPGLRRRRPARHRVAGQISVVCGLVAGASGLWMTHFYPALAGDGPLLSALRWLFGGALIACLLSGFAAIRRGDVVQHRAWLTRGYAIGLGAGTQALVHLPWLLWAGRPGESARASLMAAGWLINLAVAEWRIRKRSAQPVRTTLAT